MKSGSAEVRTYGIKVWGRLDDSWSDWLDEMTMSFAGEPNGVGSTVITISLDQAGLRGVLNRIWDLNLTVLSVSPKGVTL